MRPRIVKDINDVFGDVDLLKCSIYANALVEIDQRCLAHIIGNFILFNFFNTTRPKPAFGRLGLHGLSGGYTSGVVSAPCFKPE